MRLRFGEFPEDHHFISISRPFVEWSFKYLEWLAVVATIQVAATKTNSRVLLALEWFAYFLILAFNGGLADWFLNFRFASEGKRPKTRSRIRILAALLGGLLMTMLVMAIINLVSQSVIAALTEVQNTKT